MKITLFGQYSENLCLTTAEYVSFSNVGRTYITHAIPWAIKRGLQYIERIEIFQTVFSELNGIKA